MNNFVKPSSTKLAELLAKAREQKAKAVASAVAGSNTVGRTLTTDQLAALAKLSSLTGIAQPVLETVAVTLPNPTVVDQILDAPSNAITDKYGNIITYNERQNEFVELAAQGKDCILLGAAGTGKTTAQKGVIQRLLVSGNIPILPAGMVHKVLRGGVPGIVITSFTRRAVSNIKRNISSDLAGNCVTIHKLLEYQPEYFEVYDEKSGTYRKTMQFLPARNQYNPLPPEIKVIIIEESSMVSVELFELLKLACPHDVQFIFLGDIQQLPPTFGTAILGYKMLELPTIELTEVYRQALDSPIIRLAHRILSGVPIPATEYEEWKVPSKLTIHPWKKKLKEDVACMTAAAFLTQALNAGLYDPSEDMILCPFNKAFGTVELNKHIANTLAKKNTELLTHEIIAGFNKYYFSSGDRIMYEKEDGVILSIEPNAVYMGKTPQKASTTLDYWGHDPVIQQGGNSDFADTMDVELILSQMSGDSGEEDEKVNQASHVITVLLADSGREMILNTSAQINALLLSYALTVHKSQGSEWRKVFILLHQSHATMVQRELMYTAVTRAREELYIICEPETFTKGITSQRIKGDTLAEKAEFFRGKLEGDTL